MNIWRAGQYNQYDLWAMQAVRMHGVYSGGVAEQHVSRATTSLLCLHLHRMHSGTALSVGLCAFFGNSHNLALSNHLSDL